MPSTPASLLAGLALAGALVGVGAATGATPTQPATEPVVAEPIVAETRDRPAPVAPTADGDSISIECGGYDQHGEVVNAEATRIDRAPVDAAGIPEIPAVCGGYTADGTFIGDD